jgi:two-component system chemotaxis sensor kinase CheA
MDDGHDEEMLAEFVAESLEGLQKIESDLLTLESDGGADVELVNRIFRAVHSIKGAGAFLNLTNLVTVSHRAETLLDDIRAGRRQATSDVTDAVLGAIDSLVAMLELPDQGASYRCESILDQLDAVLTTEQTALAAAAAPAGTEQGDPSSETVAPVNAEGAVDRDPELLSEFVAESLTGLTDIEKDLLDLETAADGDPELINRIFRTIHSIKGAASFLALGNLVAVTHRAETILDRIRCQQLAVDGGVTDVILAVVDAVQTMLQSPDTGDSHDCGQLLERLDQVLDPGAERAASASVDAEVLRQLRSNREITRPVYLLDVDLEALHAAIDIQEGVIEGLNAVGVVHSASMPLEAIDTTFEGPCTIYYETVLEPDLIAAHFSIKPENITQLDLSADPQPTTTNTEVHRAESSSAPPASGGSCDPGRAASREGRAAPSDSQPRTSPPPAAEPGAKQQSSGGKGSAAGRTPAESDSAASRRPGKAPGGHSNDEQTMRVPARILHELLEWTGNMVMARNQLLNEYDFRDSNAFRTLSQAITGVHETVIETRMQTTGTLFERYRRVVRDLSRQLKKEVAFHIEGGDLELDRTILESFADPLTHLVRNCIDHALEPPDERIAAGKNRQGNVFLRSYIQSGEIILAVEDDGRGIPAEKVCEKAIAKGLVTAEQAAEMSDEAKQMLIFAPGFSTKDRATDVSGRGVGMDVVKNNIEQVGGTIALKTVPGKGSTFRAHLPLAKALVSSSLTSALVVEICGECFAIPETAISEIIRYDEHALEKVTLVDGRCVYQHRDQLVAIIDLRTPLGIEDSHEGARSPSQKLFAPESRGSRSCLVIIQFRDQLFGTVVDEVVGMQEIIVRNNPALIQNCTVYSGHTVLGNGRIALILDVNGIVNKMRLNFTEQQAAGQSAQQKRESQVTTQKMLIFNNAKNEYFAIPIELVAFIERIHHRDLKTVGDREFCQQKSETLSVVRLEDFLPVSPLDAESQEMCLIRPAAVEHPIGVITGTDLSVIDVAETFETRLDDDSGIVGTFYLDQKLVMLLDLFCILENHAPEKLIHRDDTSRPANILVAEDSLFFRKLIAQYISREEWQVEIVNDGVEAYERLVHEPHRFDLLISDINMPRMDGFQLVEKLRADKRFDRMPIVALTTMSDEHFREKGLRLGFDRYVIKIDKREVRSTVVECLAIQRNPA